MAIITPARADIEQSEVQFGASVSEATLTKVGGAINHVNNKILLKYDFRFLGPFQSGSGGEDSLIPFPAAMDIIGITGYIRLSGSSGNTTIDLHKVSGSDVTILTQQIVISGTAADNLIFGINYLEDPVTSSIPTGVTLPAIGEWTTKAFAAFEGLRVDIDGIASGQPEDLAIYVWFRPT